jgi:hypothetical protein
MNLRFGSHLKWALHFVGTIVSDKHEDLQKGTKIVFDDNINILGAYVVHDGGDMIVHRSYVVKVTLAHKVLFID